MEVLKKVSKFAGRYMAIIVLAIAVMAFFVPESFLWVGKDYNAFTRIVTVNNLLMVVMFGMGPVSYTHLAEMACVTNPR